MTTATAEQLATLLQGRVEGDPHATVNGLSKLDDSQPGTLGFLANEKYEEHLYTCSCAVVLVANDFVLRHAVSCTLLRVADPYAAFTHLLSLYADHMSRPAAGISPLAAVAAGARIAPDVYAGPYAVIEDGAEIGEGCCIFPQVFIGKNVQIGNNTILYPGVKIYHSCTIGHNCIIHAGTVIGSDGFGHAPQADGSYKKIPQTGNVEIGNDVEIGSNCSIDRATLGSTRIGHGVKLDNLVQVAHNAEIGDNTVIAAQTGISGSTRLGPGCMIGGQVGFVGHVHIAAGTKIGAQSGIMNHIEEPGKAWIGSPVYELRESFKMQAVYRNLPDMARKLKELERQLNALKKG